MPKQKGLYQLQGQLQGMCYYSQAGVKLPLMRTINQGMSERVKTSEEFENTRKNNAEFAHANYMATALYNFIYPNWRSMFRRFTIPYMTAKLIAEIQKGTGEWGERYMVGNTAGIFVPLLNQYAKARVYQGQFGTISTTSSPFFGEYPEGYSFNRIVIGIGQSDVVRLYSEGYGGILVYFRYILCTDSYTLPFAATDVERALLSPSPSATYTEITSEQINYQAFHVMYGDLVNRMQQPSASILTCAVLCPYRWSGNERVIMQKQCTYVVVGKDPYDNRNS